MIDMIIEVLITALYHRLCSTLDRLQKTSGRTTATAAVLIMIVLALLSGFIGYRVGINGCYSFACFFLAPIGVVVGIIFGLTIGVIIIEIYASAKS